MAFGPRNGATKLTAEAVAEIRVAFETDEPTRSIARRYGVNESTLRAIFKRRTWRTNAR